MPCWSRMDVQPMGRKQRWASVEERAETTGERRKWAVCRGVHRHVRFVYLFTPLNSHKNCFQMTWSSMAPSLLTSGATASPSPMTWDTSRHATRPSTMLTHIFSVSTEQKWQKFWTNSKVSRRIRIIPRDALPLTRCWQYRRCSSEVCVRMLHNYDWWDKIISHSLEDWE